MHIDRETHGQNSFVSFIWTEEKINHVYHLPLLFSNEPWVFNKRYFFNSLFSLIIFKPQLNIVFFSLTRREMFVYTPSLFTFRLTGSWSASLNMNQLG